MGIGSRSTRHHHQCHPVRMSGSLLSLRRVCAVCCQREAQYTCPRCHKAYCTSTCYQGHGQQCTEAFFREQATSKMKATKADKHQQRHMMKILQRLHQQEQQGSQSVHNGSNNSSSCEGDEHAEIEPEDSAVVGYSPEITRLMDKAAALGDAFEIQPSDLTPEVLSELEQLSLRGQLSHLVTPWQPWWTSPAAAELQLNAAGQRVVAEVVQQEQKLAAEILSQQPHGSAAATTAAGDVSMPEPPLQPLPSLSSLTGPSFHPSPLLPFQLLQLLVVYSAIMRKYNGEPDQLDGWEAAEQLMLLAPPLSQLLAVPATAGNSREQQAAAMAPPPESARSAHMQLHAAAPQLGEIARGPGHHKLLIQVAASDALRLLQLGRSCVLLALTDSKRLLTYGRQEIKRQIQRQQQVSKRTGSKHAAATVVSESEQQHLLQLQQQMKLAERKLHFFSAWCNEQPGVMYEKLSAELLLEIQEQQHLNSSGKGTLQGVGLDGTHVGQMLAGQGLPEQASVPRTASVHRVRQSKRPQHEPLEQVERQLSSTQPTYHQHDTASQQSVKAKDSQLPSGHLTSPVQQLTTQQSLWSHKDESSLQVAASLPPANSGQTATAHTDVNTFVDSLYGLD